MNCKCYSDESAFALRRALAQLPRIHAFAPSSRARSPSRSDRSDHLVGQPRVELALVLKVEDGVDNRNLFDLAQVGLLDHVVPPKPLGHFAPVPEGRVVADV